MRNQKFINDEIYWYILLSRIRIRSGLCLEVESRSGPKLDRIHNTAGGGGYDSRDRYRHIDPRFSPYFPSNDIGGHPPKAKNFFPIYTPQFDSVKKTRHSEKNWVGHLRVKRTIDRYGTVPQLELKNVIKPAHLYLGGSSGNLGTCAFFPVARFALGRPSLAGPEGWAIRSSPLATSLVGLASIITGGFKTPLAWTRSTLEWRNTVVQILLSCM